MQSEPCKAISSADIISTIQKKLTRLSKSDKKIAQYLLDKPEEFTSASVKDVASRVNISEATVVRFGRNVGCEGFKELKILLAQHLAVKQALKDSSDGVASDNENPLLQVCTAAVAALEKTSQQIKPSKIAAAASIITQSRRVFIYGIGGSSAILAEETHNRLFRLNLPCTTYTDSYLQRMSAATLESTDAAIFISSTGRPQALIESAELARYYGAHCIAITDQQSQLASQADICLNVELSQSGVAFHQPNPMRFAQLFVIDCLAHEVAMQLGDKAREMLKRVRTSVAALHGIVPQQPIGD